MHDAQPMYYGILAIFNILYINLQRIHAEVYLEIRSFPACANEQPYVASSTCNKKHSAADPRQLKTNDLLSLVLVDSIAFKKYSNVRDSRFTVT